MSTISVPINAQLEEFINQQIKEGKAANKADLVRKAILLLEEQEAINAVLDAERQPSLRGDLKELAKKFK